MGYKNIEDIIAIINRKGNSVKNEKIKKRHYNEIKAMVNYRKTKLKGGLEEEKRNIKSLKWVYFMGMSIQEPSEAFLPYDVIKRNLDFQQKLGKKKVELTKCKNSIRKNYNNAQKFFQRELNNLNNDFNLMEKSFYEESEI